MTKDPICGMTVDEATALRAERDARRSTFAASIVGKSFSPRPLPRSTQTSPTAKPSIPARCTLKSSRTIPAHAPSAAWLWN